jgi:acylphosphatase
MDFSMVLGRMSVRGASTLLASVCSKALPEFCGVFAEISHLFPAFSVTPPAATRSPPPRTHAQEHAETSPFGRFSPLFAMIAKRIVFEGRVQGVGFRYTVKDLARGFDVAGHVRNLPDGTVELIAAGEAAEIRAFVHEIVHESGLAHHIRHHFEESIPVPDRLQGFHIER